jgi:hypothetical protein
MSGNNNFVATSTTIQNTDARSALDHSTYVGAGATSTSNSVTYAADADVLKTLAQAVPDSAVALGQLSATTLKDIGGAIVNLNKDSLAANSKAWDSTLQYSAAAVDKQIDSLAAGFGLAKQVVDKFQPTDNANADIGKYAMIAVGCVALAVIFWKHK